MIRRAPSLRQYSDQDIIRFVKDGRVRLDGDTLVPIASGGALLLANDAEAQTSGTTVTTGNSGGTNASAFDAVVIGANMTLTFDSTHPAHGSNGFKFALTSTATNATYVEWNSTSIGSAFTQIWGAFYFWCSVIPPSTIRILKFLSGTTVLCYLGVASGSNQFQWRTSADSGVGTPGTALSTSTLYRCEFNVVFSATVGAATAKAYAGDSTSALATDATTTGQNFGTACDKVQFGATTANFSSTSGDAFWMDDLNLNDSGYPGVGPYTLVAPQTLLPDADNAAGGWTTTPLWSKVDDPVGSPDGTIITATAS